MAKDIPTRYYDNIRKDISHILPGPLDRVLEVGCGDGSTLAHFKAEGLFSWTAGVEKVVEVATKARKRVDVLVEGDIESMTLPFPKRSFDAILCLDVLEHLLDPWAVVKSLHSYLKPSGMLLASIPNVRFYRVVRDLLFKGQWRYTDIGILDRTHLRFFTLESAIELVECSGLKVSKLHRLGLEPNKGRARMNRLTFGIFKDLMTCQYLLQATALADHKDMP